MYLDRSQTSTAFETSKVLLQSFLSIISLILAALPPHLFSFSFNPSATPFLSSSSLSHPERRFLENGPFFLRLPLSTDSESFPCIFGLAFLSLLSKYFSRSDCNSSCNFNNIRSLYLLCILRIGAESIQ